MVIIVWLYKGDDKNEKRHKFFICGFFLCLSNFTIYSIMSCIHNTIYSSMQNIIVNIKE